MQLLTIAGIAVTFLALFSAPVHAGDTYDSVEYLPIAIENVHDPKSPQVHAALNALKAHYTVHHELGEGKPVLLALAYRDYHKMGAEATLHTNHTDGQYMALFTTTVPGIGGMWYRGINFAQWFGRYIEYKHQVSFVDADCDPALGFNMSECGQTYLAVHPSDPAAQDAAKRCWASLARTEAVLPSVAKAKNFRVLSASKEAQDDHPNVVKKWSFAMSVDFDCERFWMQVDYKVATDWAGIENLFVVGRGGDCFDIA